MRHVDGVLSTEVGFTGGHTSNATYKEVKTDQTGHAEAVKIVFDPLTISFAYLLEEYFFKMHNPTTLNRQGNDKGTRYRSAIFYFTEEQRETALAEKAKAEKLWKMPITTEVTAKGEWWRAEEVHQDYLQKKPNGYTCHWLRTFD